MIYRKLASLFTRRDFIRRLAVLTGSAVSSVWHPRALAQIRRPPPAILFTPSSPPEDLNVSLDFGNGNIATFNGATATDMGDFVGEHVRCKCYMATNPSYPDWRVFFRVDADRNGKRIVRRATGWRDEVVVEYGRTTHGTPQNIRSATPYTATVEKNGVTVYTTSVPGHWWYARWRYKSSDRPVVRTPAVLKARGWIPNFTSTGLFGLTPYSCAVAWPGPMGAPHDPCGGGFSVGMASGGDNDPIGLTTEYAAQYAIFGNANLLASVRTEGEWCGNWPTHYRDDATGAALDVLSSKFKEDGGVINDVPWIPFSDPNPEPGYVYVEAAHMYANPGMSWMLTDDPFFLEELHASLTWRILDQPSAQYPGLMRIDQTRSFAWGLRDLFLAVKTTPAVTPSWLRNKAYWQTALTNNLTFAMRYVNGPSRLSKIFKTWTITSFDGSWQTSWLNAVVGQGVLMGFSEWAPVFNWAVDGHIQMTNGTSGWPRQWPAPYYWFPDKDGGISIRIYDLTGATDATNCTSWGDAWAFYKSGGGVAGGGIAGTESDERGVPVDSYDGGPQASWDSTTLYQKYGYQGIGTLTESHLQALRAELAIAVSNGTTGAQGCYDWIHSKVPELMAHSHATAGQARFSVEPATSLLADLAAGKVRNLGPYANANVASGISITDYSGTVLDSVAKRILIFGGGHGPCNETDIRAFDLQLLTWSSVYPSTAEATQTIANLDQTRGRWLADNKPVTRHSYGMNVVIGNKFYCMQAVGMPYHPRGSIDEANIYEPQWGGRIWWYDFNAATHSYSNISQEATPWYQASGACVDPISGKIVVVGTDGNGSGRAYAWLYDPTNDTILQICNGGFNLGAYANKLVYDSVADRFISFSSDGTGVPIVCELALNRATPTSSTLVKVTPTGQVPSGFVNGFGWDQSNRKAAGGVYRGLFYLYDAVNRTWAQQQMVKETGGNATMDGTYGCEFDPTSGCYIFLCYVNQSVEDGNTYAYRPT